MAIFRNLVFWFSGLLVLLVAGFWKSYFSVFFDGPHPTHHFHGVVMTLWVMLLISQAWLVRRRNLDLHRLAGRTAYVLGPLVVISGVIVTFHNIAGAPDPMAPFFLSLYWLGWFSALAFGILFALAIIHRRNFHLHARYMIATALVFVLPGMSRLVSQLAQRFEWPAPEFYEFQVLVGLLGVALIAWDRMHGRLRAPFVVFTVLWGMNLVIWKLIPGWAWWQAFTAWSVAAWQA